MDDTFSDVKVDLTVPETDAAGVTEATGTIGDLADTTLAAESDGARSRSTSPAGAPPTRTSSFPSAPRDVAIGIRPAFEDGSVAENARAGFEAIAVDADGKRIALNGLTFAGCAKTRTISGIQDNGAWKYQSVTRDRLITSGTMDIGAGNAR